jgi:hypothetical protein
MQPTNQHKPQISRCVYCGSTARGKGCRYGPHSVHFFSDDLTKCGYCGSSSYGKGCKVNPTSDLHVHGVTYNNMYKEHVQSFLDNAVLLEQLKKDYKHFQCHALGIIDQFGNKIKKPITIQEQISYTPFIKTILKLKRFLGAKIDLFEACDKLEALTTSVDENVKHYEKVVHYQDKINNLVNELYKTLDEAQRDGLAFDDVKKLIKA